VSISLDDTRFDLVDPAGDLAARLIDRYFDDLAALLAEDFDPNRGPATSPEAFAWPRGAFIAAFVHDAPFGCGGVQRIGTSTGEIKRMWIDASMRGQGLGHALLTTLENYAGTLGLSRILLDTHSKLLAANALYQASGYVEVDDYNDNPAADRWFEKRLDAL
jgi:GNAT superfamily N-acetyltransferase